MIENKKIQNRLLITIIILCIFEAVVCLNNNEIILIESLSNINIGIIGSSIVSYVISIITYNYKKEETLELMSKEVLNIYSKMVQFKCIYNNSEDKNREIIKLQEEINESAGKIYSIEYDLVNKLKIGAKEETLALYKYNDKAAKELGEGVQVNRKTMFNTAKGVNTQKEFIDSFNSILKNVRDYLNNNCSEKYIKQYEMFNIIDKKYEDIVCTSNIKINYKV